MFWFVDDLSGWRPSTNSERREKHEDELTDKQKEMLETYRSIREENVWRSEFQKKFCGAETLEGAIKSTEKTVPSHHEKLEQIYREFDEIYREIHREKEGIINKVKEDSKKVWEDLDKDPLEEISRTMDLEWGEESIEVIFYYRGPGPKGGIGGGPGGEGAAAVYLYDDTLEGASAKDFLGTILHELIHKIQKRNGKTLRNVVKEEYGSSFQDRSQETLDKCAAIIDEGFCDSLAPCGLLTHTILGKEIDKTYKRPSEWSEIARDAYYRLLFPIVEDYYNHRYKRNFWDDCLPKIIDRVTAERYPKKT